MVFSTQTILGNFTYYKKLSPQEKVKFVNRVERFIDSKEFVGKAGFQITEETKVEIAATAVQLTFGLEKYLMEYFEKFIIYPDQFYSRLSKSNNVGEVNLGGAIVLSWKAFEEGWEDEKDSYNVALHEMAHSLNFTDQLNKDIDPDFSMYFPKWYVVARKILEKRDAVAKPFLRKYSGRNIQEFFAVGVESFFERPADFKKELPELYEHYCCLLNQDPLNEDYKITYADPSEPKETERLLTLQSKPKKMALFEKYWQLFFIGSLFTAVSLKVALFFPLGMVSFLFVLLQFRKNVRIDVFPELIKFYYPHRLVFQKVNQLIPASLVCIDFVPQESLNQRLEISYYHQGKVYTTSQVVYTDFDSMLPFLKLQYELNDVAIKYNGSIFIPEAEEKELKRG